VLIRRRTSRTLLRRLIPLLALVWAFVPLHRCNLALAHALDGMQPHAAMPACEHCPESQSAAQGATLHCAELGNPAPDQRSAVLGVAAFLLHSRPEQLVPVRTVAGDSALARAQLRPPLDPPDRPLHLTRLVLQI
jgi:hypothetical protein